MSVRLSSQALGIIPEDWLYRAFEFPGHTIPIIQLQSGQESYDTSSKHWRGGLSGTIVRGSRARSVGTRRGLVSRGVVVVIVVL